MVRALEGVGVTMLSGETPLAEGARDESAVLESNTSPETQPSYIHIVRGEETHTHTSGQLSHAPTPRINLTANKN